MPFLTEQQATGLVCHKSVTGQLADYAGTTNNDGTVMCIASRCMAWREGEPVWEVADAGPGIKPDGDGWERVTQHDYGGGGTKTSWRRPKVKRGFCGLAGRPR